MSLSETSKGAAPLPPSVSLANLVESDQDNLIDLHARVFGPGRFARTAFRLRETAGVLDHLCFAAHEQDRLVGAVTLSRIVVDGPEGETAGVLLGPLAVEPSLRDKGVGKALLHKSVKAAFEAGEGFVLLVGDLPYYQTAGFQVVPFGQLSMPGPVAPSRLLVACNPSGFDPKSLRGAVRGAPV